MMERVKQLSNFFDDREIEFLMKVSDEIKRSNIKKPVLYAGSGGDVEHGVILGDDLIFVDSHLPEVTLSEIRGKIVEIGGKILREWKEGELGNGGRYVIEFEFLGKIRITYYAEDVLDVLKEVEDLSVYFVKVPHPKEQRSSDLTSPEVLSKALKKIALRGFFLERECPLPNPELLGFERVCTGYISALSIRKSEGNLYRKVKDLSLEEILKVLKGRMISIEYKF